MNILSKLNTAVKENERLCQEGVAALTRNGDKFIAEVKEKIQCGCLTLPTK